ncbi:peptidylprolyl isomerase [Maricaulis sp.]|uniref:peptidylprolyl isomerase n=1 Tax=Maricaulis sp. TaxID=1486257 RepID=UPI003A8E7DA9
MTGHSIITPKAPTPEVSVNGVVIPAKAIAAETQHHPARRPEAAWQAAAEALAIREALLQAARARGVTAPPATETEPVREVEEDALIQAFVDQQVTTPDPDEESCRRYFSNNRDKLRAPDLYEPAHILLQASKEDSDGYERARLEAQTLVEHLQKRPDDFDRIARDRSDCSSASDGGRLGQVTRGQTTPAFEAAMMKLRPGEMTGEAVETPYGFHIIRLDHLVRGEVPEFELARPLVEEFLRDASWRRAVAQFVSLVVGEAKISGIEIRGATSPLVQ